MQKDVILAEKMAKDIEYKANNPGLDYLIDNIKNYKL